MITWTTRKSIVESLADLENALLAQTVEHSYFMLKDMLGEGSEDPSSRAWQMHEKALAVYCTVGLLELQARGIRKVDFPIHPYALISRSEWARADHFAKPKWMEDTDILLSHRSNLIRRDKSYASKFPKTPQSMPYLWPVVDESGDYKIIVSRVDKERLSSGERKLSNKIKERVYNLS